jgi:hypothetical protein
MLELRPAMIPVLVIAGLAALMLVGLVLATLFRVRGFWYRFGRPLDALASPVTAKYRAPVIRNGDTVQLSMNGRYTSVRDQNAPGDDEDDDDEVDDNETPSSAKPLP